MTLRSEWELWESKVLHPRAAKSAESQGRLRPENECDLRTCYQRDRDRIVHSKAFRRLKHKTQVFIAPLGDHFRTRLTHTLEVSQIARTISRALRLNEDLTEAIALAHDLGHTPFGHAGEKVLNELMPEGFSHPVQSLRVVDLLEKGGKGLNLTYEVRDGILKHSKGLGSIFPKEEERPVTLEAEVVRIADIIAYVNHDIDDAIRAGLIKEDELPRDCVKVLGTKHSERINTMVKDVVNETKRVDYERVAMSREVVTAVYKLRKFLNNKVYSSSVVYKEFIKSSKLVAELYGYFVENPSQIKTWCIEDDPPEIKAGDYISGMTDRYAIYLYRILFLPKPWQIKLGEVSDAF